MFSQKLCQLGFLQLFSCLLMGAALLPGIAQADPNAKIVAGKIVAVSHEKVTVNNVVMDKSMVTVDNCDARGTLTTVNFTPSTISDRSVLGHLFDQTILSAQAANLEKLQQPNGFGIFWVDNNSKVLRAGLLGHGQDCRNISGFVSQFP